jgi:hypothetical protein
LCHRDACACRLERLVLLRCTVLARLELLAGRFHLGAALVEFRLRDDALLEQRLDPREFTLRQLVGRFRVLHFGHRIDVQSRPQSDRAALRSCALASASLTLRRFRCRQADGLAALTDCGPAPGGVATTRPRFGGDVPCSRPSAPVARMKRAIGCSVAATGAAATATAAVAARSLVLPSAALHAPVSRAVPSVRLAKKPAMAGCFLWRFIERLLVKRRGPVKVRLRQSHIPRPLIAGGFRSEDRQA